MNHPRMTSDGRKWAGVIGIIVAFMLPYHADCGSPGAECVTIVDHRECRSYELEPWGFSLIERVVGHDVGFAYSTGVDCS